MGHLVYLEAKAKGDNSILGKRGLPKDVKGNAPQDPRDMAKAGLPEV